MCRAFLSTSRKSGGVCGRPVRGGTEFCGLHRGYDGPKTILKEEETKAEVKDEDGKATKA